MRMTKAEREQFLAEPRVGIIGIDEGERAPRVVPLWYGFDPVLGVWVLTREKSRKTDLLRKAGAFSLCVQEVTPFGYRHVSVQGPIIETRPCELERDFRPMVHRYLDCDTAEHFIAKSWSGERVVFLMRPEHWVTADLAEVLAAHG